MTTLLRAACLILGIVTGYIVLVYLGFRSIGLGLDAAMYNRIRKERKEMDDA